MSRRDALRTTGVALSGVGAALLFGCGGGGKAGDDDANGPPEVTTIRFPNFYGTCLAPLYVAKQYLLDEGFKTVDYVTQARIAQTSEKLTSADLDMGMDFAAPVSVSVDKGSDIVALAMAHVGCFELFAQKGINSPSDLRGKTVGISTTAPNAADYAFMASIMSFIGIRDGEYKLDAYPTEQVIKLFGEKKLDAVLAYPPISSQLRTFGYGQVILNSMVDPGYSQYGCCLILANRQFLEKNPAATKRALRSILRGADFCAQEPEKAAQYLVDNSFILSYQYALEAMKSIPYDVWRSHGPEETLRHYALRLKETGVIKSTPDQIIKNGTDWRFLNELKQELAYFPRRDGGRSAFALDCAIQGPQEG